MRLVLGLAALAVALSSTAGSGHYLNNGLAEAKANPTDAQKVGNDAFIQEKKDVRVTDFGTGLAKAAVAGTPGDAYWFTTEKSGDNDSPATAQGIGPIMSNGWDFTHYSSSGSPTLQSIDISGYIAQEKGQDWYTFTIYGKADFDIYLTGIPDQCDYDLALYKASNQPNQTADYLVTSVTSSTAGSNRDEHISRRLLPGVYYVKVYSYRGYGSPTYTLSLFGDYVREDVCIEEMMAKGANAALWYSDYDPFGIKPSTTGVYSHNVGEIYKRSIVHNNDYDHYHPEFPHVIDQQYKQAELFVWGKAYRTRLRSLVGRILQEAEDEYNSAVDLYLATKKTGTTISLVIGALGAVASVISLGTWTGATVAGVVSLSLSLGGLAYEVVSALLPDGMNFQNYQRFIDYLGDLYAALECDAYTSDDEVVMIPIRYTLKEVKTNGPINTDTSPSYIYDWYNKTTYTMSYAPAQRQWNYLYNDGGKVPGQRRYIHAIDHQGDTPFTGTIYPVFDDESMNKAWNRQTYDMSFTTLTNNVQSSAFSLSAGNYKWFKFTAPRSATFHFTSEGDSSAFAEVFGGMVYGKSTYQRNAVSYQDNGFYSGFKYSKYLTQGQTVYLRVSGGYESYNGLASTTVKVSDKTNEKTATFYADELNLPTNWGDPIPTPTSYLLGKGARVIAKENARINEDSLLELEADCHEEFFRAYVTIKFDRPIKRIAIDAAYGTWWRYSRNPLIINGLNANGQTVITYWEDGMDYDFFEHYQTYSFLLKDPSQGVTDNIYSVQFMLDPYQTQDSYHSSYEMVHIGGFTVEYAD